MLNDLERKLLRILSFLRRSENMPTKPELEHTTGRRYFDTEKAQMVQHRYIGLSGRNHFI